MPEIEIRYREVKKEKEKYFVNIARFISLIFISAGLLLSLYTILPYLSAYVRTKTIENKTTDDSTIILSYYNPNTSYFENLTNKAYEKNITNNFNKNQIVNTEYNKTMYLTIPSINLENVKITPNIESTNKETYDQYLKKGIAHFKYTPLPGDGGNSFLYGHSVGEPYFTYNPYNPEIILTNLKNIEIGDSIKIKKDNIDISYKVIKIEIVLPNDVKILSGIAGKETVTLMTCYPWGVGTHRFIVIAEIIDL